MDNRRDFLKKAMLLSGATGMFTLPASIQKAFAIDPEPGSTFLDAEHVVFLMQENRSFDHAFGTLRGVRGFNDPRAVTLPNGHPVWLQTNAANETYAPFRFNIKDTKITWMGSLPHGWDNQTDAFNKGNHDKWLDSKPSSRQEFSHMPLTMGYYTREDIPFYYALADAFTVCDQNFCSSLTGTTPNRLHFWTGTIRAAQQENAQANVWNEEADYPSLVEWKTYPERLEEAGVSWKIYQNEISIDGGFTEEEDAWLSSFTDNPIEFFKQYHIKLSPRYINYLPVKADALTTEIKTLQDKLQSTPATSDDHTSLSKKIKDKQAELDAIKKEQELYTIEKFNALPDFQKSIHAKAFTVNSNDPLQHKLTSLQYDDNGTERTVNIPAGDVLHQFRQDVSNGSLPTVSWIVPPETFSDHPSSAWYGAWYLSEVMDVLTKNPDVWKKTIFILTYDENDGYYDHIPPFVAPNAKDAATGKASNGIDTSIEFVTLEQEKQRTHMPEDRHREAPIGLGFRVPLVIASPWSRGGMVCSEVFDHTSSLRFLETFLQHKTNKKIAETNISAWRRTVCGDLTNAFSPFKDISKDKLDFLQKDIFIESIHQAKFKSVPNDYKQLTAADIQQAQQHLHASGLLPLQEKGTKPACALPYELYVDGKLKDKNFEVIFQAKNNVFGTKALGSPFTVHANNYNNHRVRNYAVVAGDQLNDSWQLTDFNNSKYHLEVYGPNGFYRSFKGSSNEPVIDISCTYQHDAANAKKLTGNVEVNLINNDNDTAYTIEITDNAYKQPVKTIQLSKSLAKGAQSTVILSLNDSYNWYDFSVKIKGSNAFERRYAGHVETGSTSSSDPLMGKMV
jgi:phospholipase C